MIIPINIVANRKNTTTKSKLAGNLGENEVTILAFTFSDDWNGTSKTIVYKTPAGELKLPVDLEVDNTIEVDGGLFDAVGTLSYTVYGSFGNDKVINASGELLVGEALANTGGLTITEFTDIIGLCNTATQDAITAKDAAVLATERIETTDADIQAAEGLRVIAETEREERAGADHMIAAADHSAVAPTIAKITDIAVGSTSPMYRKLLLAFGGFTINGFDLLNYYSNRPNRAALKDIPLSAQSVIGFLSTSGYTTYKFAIGYTGPTTNFIGGGYQGANEFVVPATSAYSVLIARNDDANMTADDISYINASFGVVSTIPQSELRYFATPASPLDGKSILALGDSFLTANNPLAEVDTWLYKLADKHKMAFRNYGLSGSSLAFSSTQNYKSLMERYKGIIASVPSPDYIVVLIGHNDSNPDLHGGSAIPIGTDSDIINTTFKGALNLLISELITACPASKILMLTPFNRRGTEAAYSTAMQTISGKYSVSCFDNYTKSGICFQNSAQAAMYDLGGTLHLNAVAQTRYSHVVEAQLELL